MHSNSNHYMQLHEKHLIYYQAISICIVKQQQVWIIIGSVCHRVTSLEQLSVAEFSREQARLKVYKTAKKMFYQFGLIWYLTSKLGCNFRK
jgi:hypothetical protein